MAQSLAACVTRRSVTSLRSTTTITTSASRHPTRLPAAWSLHSRSASSSSSFFSHLATRTSSSSPSFLPSTSITTITPRRNITTTTTKMAPLPNTSKTVQISKNGGVEVLEVNDVPIPQLKDGEVLIRNHYAGVNFIDTYFRAGLYPAPQFPLSLGREGAGEVVAAHDSVAKEFTPGTRVVYMNPNSYAQYTAVPAAKVVAIPENLSTELAAAAFLQGLTAWTFIREAGEVKAGQWVLVHAASGGVGQVLVQLVRAVGAKVIGTASTEEKLELARKNGAEWTINSHDDIVTKVKEITGGHGIDVIFDGVGKSTFEADMEMIALKGSLISFGNASGAVPPVDILRLGAKNVRLMRPVVFGYVSTREELVKYSNELFEFLTSGKLDIKIHEVYPLAEVARAHTDLESRKSSGKLLLKCN